MKVTPGEYVVAALALLLMVLILATPGRAAQSSTSSLFAFTTDDFWLNLHHYLYVVGRARAHMPDATQQAVAGAPDDERDGLLRLTEEERQVWEACATEYANGL